MLVDYPTKEYRTFECLEPKAIVPSGTQKNGSTLPSKSPALKQIIGETATMRDNWDESDDGKEFKKLTKKVAAYKCRWGQIGIAPAARGDTANVDDE